MADRVGGGLIARSLRPFSPPCRHPVFRYNRRRRRAAGTPPRVAPPRRRALALAAPWQSLIRSRVQSPWETLRRGRRAVRGSGSIAARLWRSHAATPLHGSVLFALPPHVRGLGIR